MLERLGLVYGAIDMRRTPDGEYYFFEVNTAGEFLFIEDRTGQPIARAIADWLIKLGRRTIGRYVTFLTRIVSFWVGAPVTG